MLMTFFRILFISSFTTNSSRFSKFDSRDAILFRVKVFGRNIKETTLAWFFIQLTVLPSFAQLRVIRIIIRVHGI